MRIKAVKSYGVLAHEGHPVYSEMSASDIYENIEIDVPEEQFEIAKNKYDQILIRPVEEKRYWLLNEILINWGDVPAFQWVGEDGKKHRKILKEM